MPVRLDMEIVITPNPTIMATAFFASAERAKSLDQPMGQATEIYATEIDLNFMSQGRPSHWEPLSLATIKRRLAEKLGGSSSSSDVAGETKRQELKRMDPSAAIAQLSAMISDVAILMDTDTLHSEASSPSSWAISGSGQTVLAEMTTSEAVYGFYHLEGTSHMPIRDWAYISDAALEEIDQLFADWVTEPL